jgi:hypothetical protein
MFRHYIMYGISYMPCKKLKKLAVTEMLGEAASLSDSSVGLPRELLLINRMCCCCFAERSERELVVLL